MNEQMSVKVKKKEDVRVKVEARQRQEIGGYKSWARRVSSAERGCEDLAADVKHKQQYK